MTRFIRIFGMAAEQSPLCDWLLPFMTYVCPSFQAKATRAGLKCSPLVTFLVFSSAPYYQLPEALPGLLFLPQESPLQSHHL